MTSPATAPHTTPGAAYPLNTRIAVEALGSFFIVFAGLGTALFSGTASSATVGFAYGIALMVALVSFGHISGGYFNPALSLAMAVAGRLKWLAMVLYMVAQVIGGILAAAVFYVLLKVMPAGSTPEIHTLFASLANGFDSHSPSKVPMVGVLIVEIIAMAVLVAVILGATAARNKTTLAPLGIGLAFAVAITITVPLSNGSLNPARATAVVFLADSWALGQLWLFWLAPLFGAALAAALYRSFQPAPAPVGSPAEEDRADDAGAPDAATVVAPSPTDAQEQLPKPVPAAPSDEARDFFDGPRK